MPLPLFEIKFCICTSLNQLILINSILRKMWGKNKLLIIIEIFHCGDKENIGGRNKAIAW